jgi:hypothetical protein
LARWLVVVVTLVALLTAPTVANAGPHTPGNVDELLQAYGIADAPSDYVVVVDTSGSMSDPPALYPPVVNAYKQFVDAIGAQDQLSVITFDVAPDVRFSGDLSSPAKRSDATNALPAAAQGNATDIGAALSATLERLERPGSNEVQTVIFLTDGKIFAPGSPYEQTSSPAWQGLEERAAQVMNGHRLSVYGAGLGGNATDVAVLKNVFPSSQIVSLPADQLSGFFKDAVQRARVLRLYTPITKELQEGFVSVDVTPGRLASTTTLRVRMRSKFPHLGARVIVKSIEVTDAHGTSLQARLVGGPRTVELTPSGISAPIEVQVEQPLPNAQRIGTETQNRQFSVRVDASVTAEPADVIGKSLGITTEGRLVQSDPVTASRTVGTPVWWFLVALAVLSLLVLLAVWIYRRFVRTPPLPGGVLLENGTFEPFRGSMTAVPNKDIMIPQSDGAVVEFFTKRGKFRGRTPRMYVRKLQGANRVLSYGVERPLHTEQQVMPTDFVLIGRARVRVTSKSS